MGVRTWGAGLVAVMLLLGAAAPATAQRRPSDRWREPPPASYAPVKAWLGIDILAADPQGDFARMVDNGGGARVEGIFPVDGRGAVAVRLDGGFLIYGHERRTGCFPLPVGCRIGLDVTTDNAIFFAGVGPELSATGTIRPYVNGMLGFSVFATTSSVSGTYSQEPFATTQHLSDFVWAERVGGGVRFQVKGGRHPLLLDAGAQYHHNGVAEYLVKGAIEDRPDGSIVLHPNRTEADLVTLNVGLKVGFGRGGEQDRRRR